MVKKDYILVLSLLNLVIVIESSQENYYKLNTGKFPDDLLFGTASSAYQIEGGWDADGKGENSWDRFTHTHPEKIKDRSNGNVACDSYNKYKEDVALLKDLGVDFYRFSLSWSRILPGGFINKVNKAGIAYYNNVINELLAHNITPVLTLFHWDLPQNLEHLGGFTNPLIEEWFTDYAKLCFEEFGDRVKTWTTFNEPRQICSYGYGQGTHAPGVESAGIGNYICGHFLLKSHARAYHLYKEAFQPVQKGKIGIVIECAWFEPATESNEDVAAAERARQFFFGWFSNPIFSPDGDYPSHMKVFIANRSKEEGFLDSRLPKFTAEEIDFIKGSSDYYGLNHYTTIMSKHKPRDAIGDPSQTKDFQVTLWQNDSWVGVEMFKIVPWGFRKVLKWIKDNYQDPEIYITENGFPDTGSIHDQARIDYHTEYLSNLLDSIYKDGVKVKVYTVWSIIDLFEWIRGYTIGFGLYYTNFTDPARPRTAKDSAEFYKNIIKDRKLPSQKLT